MILAIFLYTSYVYNDIFTHLNSIFDYLGWVVIDFFYLWQVINPLNICHNVILFSDVIP